MDYGWSKIPHEAHDWKTLKDNVQNYIKKASFAYTAALSEANVDYINARAVFKDADTV